ncbi:MAG TPA: diacylglycerol kinase family protein [Ktedonobacterales bacterium]|nr:diacylglycerol kinase family protein [Ktedonobacterales bacterium]
MSYQTLPGDPSHSGAHNGPHGEPPAPRGPSAPPIPPTSRGELIAFFNSFIYAWHGLTYAVRTQRNARVHMALAMVAILLGLLLHISSVEWAMVFIAITLVFIAEMFNTVAEACVDLVTREYNPLARIAKDVAAGAVLLNAMLSVLIGALVFIPHLWPLVWPLAVRLFHL